jgi:hypothetical protein
MGNPWKPSPKARLRAAAGGGFPFDRHDWFVDRGGKQVHYIIDYWYNPAGVALADAPEPFDASAKFTRSIYVDVRPAVEGPGDALDRLRLLPGRLAAALRRPRFVAEGLNPKDAPKDDEAGAAAAAPQYSSDKHSDAPPAAKAGPARAAPGGDPVWDAVDGKCGPLLDKLKAAASEDDRRSASVALNYCMGRHLCPGEAAAFMAHLEGNARAGSAGAAGGDEEAAFDAMTKCVAAAVAGRARAAAGGAAPAQAPKMA